MFGSSRAVFAPVLVISLRDLLLALLEVGVGATGMFKQLQLLKPLERIWFCSSSELSILPEQPLKPTPAGQGQTQCLVCSLVRKQLCRNSQVSL